VRSLVLSLLIFAACTGARSPEVRVIGVADAPRHEVVFVQVSNPAKRALRLTKLEYKFAAGRATISEGEIALAREVPAGATIVVEIPLDADPPESPMTLSGKLTAQLDEIVRTFDVSAQIQPDQVAK
jgi:LEA14-like dessication related protein